MNSEMTITLREETCAVTCTWKAYLLLKRQFEKIRRFLQHYFHFR